MSVHLNLISHYLCPYVQRAVIALLEKDTPFERTYIDLSSKPDWFLKISPLGRVPVLSVDGQAVFESAVILEYLEDTCEPRLHPEDPLEKAQHRSWMEFGSSVLNDIGGLYSAKDEDLFSQKLDVLKNKFSLLEERLTDGPYFSGKQFSLVDAVYAPVFRYFDVFDRIQDFGVFERTAKVSDWRASLKQRPSVINAVTADYEDRLWQFLLNRNSHITGLMA